MPIAKKEKKELVRSYTGIPHVDYWRINKGGVASHVNYVCFGSMKNPPDAVRYIAPISEKLKEGALDFYLNFIKRVLKTEDGPKFTMRKVKPTELGGLLYRLDTSDMSYIQALFYLTWFRYPYEFPEMVNELFIRKVEGDTDDILFHKFQEAHAEANAGKIKLTYNNMGGHGLIYNYNGYDDAKVKEPITLVKLHENIKAKPKTVHEYFV